MAGYNSIQILRSHDLSQSSNKTTIPIDGQPLYDQATGKLFIGDGTTTAENLSAVVAHGINSLSGSSRQTNIIGSGVDIDAQSGTINATGSAINLYGSTGVTIHSYSSPTRFESGVVEINGSFWQNNGSTTINSSYVNVNVSSIININTPTLQLNAKGGGGSGISVESQQMSIVYDSIVNITGSQSDSYVSIGETVSGGRINISAGVHSIKLSAPGDTTGIANISLSSDAEPLQISSTDSIGNTYTYKFPKQNGNLQTDIIGNTYVSVASHTKYSANGKMCVRFYPVNVTDDGLFGTVTLNTPTDSAIKSTIFMCNSSGVYVTNMTLRYVSNSVEYSRVSTTPVQLFSRQSVSGSYQLVPVFSDTLIAEPQVGDYYNYYELNGNVPATYLNTFGIEDMEPIGIKELYDRLPLVVSSVGELPSTVAEGKIAIIL